MPKEEIVEQPLEIYRPFTVRETEILRDFVVDVRLLGGMSLFEQVPKKASVTWDAEAGHSTEMKEPSDESVRAALTVFRQLYTGSEPHSFKVVINLLKASVHDYGGPRRQEALDFFAYYPEEHRNRMRPGIGISFENPDGSGHDIDTATIIDAYAHGLYLHGTNEKSKLARQLDDLRPLPRFTFYRAMYDLADLYWMAGNVVDVIFATPELLDVDSGKDAAA